MARASLALGKAKTDIEKKIIDLEDKSRGW
jgi:hypothetical protein